MESLENFFDHKIFFTNEEVNVNKKREGITLTTTYKSQTLYDPMKYNINTVPRMVDKIRPFIKYLKNKHMEKIQCYNYQFWVGVSISYTHDNLQNEYGEKIINTNFEDIDGGEDELNEIIKYETKILPHPFKIHVEISNHYYPAITGEILTEYSRGNMKVFFLI